MATTYAITAYPKEVPLRDGPMVTIRPLEPGDEQPLLDFFRGIPDEERFYLKDDVTSSALIHEWVHNVDYRRALPLVALDGGRIVAEAVLVRRRGKARSHVADVRIVVAPECRNRGLGTLMIRELCDIADDEELDKVLIELVAEKEPEALEAAERMGFLRAGVIEGGARDYDGSAHDIITLVMPLGKWYRWSKY